MIAPIINYDDDSWVRLVGRYMLNMGAIEAATRLLITIHEKNDKSPVLNSELESRIGYLRNRFPRSNNVRHSWAMNVFEVAKRHAGFRNIIAHSPLVISELENKEKSILGIMNLTPNDLMKAGELIQLNELSGRVNESARIGSDLLEMQNDYGE